MTLHFFVRPLVASTFLCITAVPIPAFAQDRGELLYSTHCLGCHTTQVHWRAKRVVTDWKSLRVEVGNWQRSAMLDWSEDDVTAVARYLNDTSYHFVVPHAMKMENPSAVGAVIGGLPGLRP